MESLAPIAFFVFRRPEHTKKVLDSLMTNSLLCESVLYVFCEAPRSIDDQDLVDRTRELVRTYAQAKQVHIIERSTNMGCANSIISGINCVLEQFDRVIVLEDDVVVSRYFLDYMNQALSRYSNERRVMHISAYNFPVEASTNQGSAFLPMISSWGWGTWRRAWSLFDADLSALPWLNKRTWRRFRFDLYGAYRYYKMLLQCRDREIDAWDIRWYLTVFRHSGLGLFPCASLTANIGFDETATHFTDPRFTQSVAEVADARVNSWPTFIRINWTEFHRTVQFLSFGRPWRTRISELIRTQLGLRVQQ